MEIPKKIHYCWFGYNPKPDIVLRCISSWKKFMPEYEICEWNENNYDCHKIPFIEEAYKKQKWAFVSDYARFDILFQYGGIYFDTDVELLKPIPQDILCKVSFTGMEMGGIVSPGLVFACVPHFHFLENILRYYQNLNFEDDPKKIKTVNTITTELLIPFGYQKENKFQEISDISIYPAEYFCSYDLDIHEYAIGPESISVHHYAGSWASPNAKSILQAKLKRLIGFENYRKMLLLKRRVYK